MDKQRDTYIHRQRDIVHYRLRQRDKEINEMQIERETERQKGTERDRNTNEIQTEIETDRNRQILPQKQNKILDNPNRYKKEIQIQGSKERERERERERQRKRE